VGTKLTDGENDKKDKGLSQTAAAYRKASPILDASWQMVGAAALGTFLGWWLDKKLGTAPWLLLVGAVLGVATGMYAFIRSVLIATRPRQTGREEKRKEDGG
jgi:ATP synthase protein I